MYKYVCVAYMLIVRWHCRCGFHYNVMNNALGVLGVNFKKWPGSVM